MSHVCGESCVPRTCLFLTHTHSHTGGSADDTGADGRTRCALLRLRHHHGPPARFSFSYFSAPSSFFSVSSSSPSLSYSRSLSFTSLLSIMQHQTSDTVLSHTTHTHTHTHTSLVRTTSSFLPCSCTPPPVSVSYLSHIYLVSYLSHIYLVSYLSCVAQGNLSGLPCVSSSSSSSSSTTSAPLLRAPPSSRAYNVFDRTLRIKDYSNFVVLLLCRSCHVCDRSGCLLSHVYM